MRLDPKVRLSGLYLESALADFGHLLALLNSSD